MNLDFSGYTDIGGRENNEDAVYTGKIHSGCLFVVADGLGGHECGEVASTSAIEAIKQYFQEGGENLEVAIERGNQAVFTAQSDIGKKAKTTIAAAYITETVAHFAHVGDSRIYVFQNNEILYQSKDHSASQLAVNLGEISLSEIRNHEERNILTRALGSVECVKTDVFSCPTSEIDAVLICSDGFWEYVLEKTMTETLSTEKSAEEWLKKMCGCLKKNISEGNDNNSAIAIILDGGKRYE